MIIMGIPKSMNRPNTTYPVLVTISSSVTDVSASRHTPSTRTVPSPHPVLSSGVSGVGSGVGGVDTGVGTDR